MRFLIGAFFIAALVYGALFWTILHPDRGIANRYQMPSICAGLTSYAECSEAIQRGRK